MQRFIQPLFLKVFQHVCVFSHSRAGRLERSRSSSLPHGSRCLACPYTTPGRLWCLTHPWEPPPLTVSRLQAGGQYILTLLIFSFILGYSGTGCLTNAAAHSFHRGRHGNQYDSATQQDSGVGRHTGTQNHSSGAAHSRSQQGKRTKARHAESRARYPVLLISHFVIQVCVFALRQQVCFLFSPAGRCPRCIQPPLWSPMLPLPATSLSPSSSLTRRAPPSASLPSTATLKMRMIKSFLLPGEPHFQFELSRKVFFYFF